MELAPAREVGGVRYLLLRVLGQALSVSARAHPAQSTLGRHIPLRGFQGSSADIAESKQGKGYALCRYIQDFHVNGNLVDLDIGAKAKKRPKTNRFERAATQKKREGIQLVDAAGITTCQ